MNNTLAGILLLGAGAVGFGIGYAVHKPGLTECQKLYDQDMTVGLEKCDAAYDKDLTRIANTFKEMPVTPGIADINDLSITYLISEEGNFKGLTFKDNASGKEGVIAKNHLFGKNNFQLQYTDLSKILESKKEAKDVKAEIKVYETTPEKEEDIAAEGLPEETGI